MRHQTTLAPEAAPQQLTVLPADGGEDGLILDTRDPATARVVVRAGDRLLSTDLSPADAHVLAAALTGWAASHVAA